MTLTITIGLGLEGRVDLEDLKFIHVRIDSQGVCESIEQ
jgi:hypothetical protein